MTILPIMTLVNNAKLAHKHDIPKKMYVIRESKHWG